MPAVPPPSKARRTSGSRRDQRGGPVRHAHAGSMPAIDAGCESRIAGCSRRFDTSDRLSAEFVRHRSRRLRVSAGRGNQEFANGGYAVTDGSQPRRGKGMKKTGTATVRYESRTTIARPVGEVFARLADLDGYGTWMHRTGLFRRSGQTSEGPRGPGTTYSDATRMGTFRGQITDYQPPLQIGFRETLRWFGSDSQRRVDETTQRILDQRRRCSTTTTN